MVILWKMVIEIVDLTNKHGGFNGIYPLVNKHIAIENGPLK